MARDRVNLGVAARSLELNLRQLDAGLENLSEFLGSEVQMPKPGGQGKSFGDRIETIRGELTVARQLLRSDEFKMSIRGKTVSRDLQAPGLEGIRKVLIDTDAMLDNYVRFMEAGQVTPHSENANQNRERLNQTLSDVDRPLTKSANLLMTQFGMEIQELANLRSKEY